MDVEVVITVGIQTQVSRHCGDQLMISLLDQEVWGLCDCIQENLRTMGYLDMTYEEGDNLMI